jgi:DNA-binding LacI/PurR family transcriptional regulator
MGKPSSGLYPASERVLHTLQERITQGYYRVGAWLPTERDLAEELAVSRPMVRVAISRLAEQGLLVRKPGCRPRVGEIRGRAAMTDVVTIPPRQTAIRTIAAVFPQHPAYHAASLILHGINLEMRNQEADFRVLVFDTYDEGGTSAAKLEREALNQLTEEGVSGIILWHQGGSATLPELLRIQARGIPLVLVDRYPAGMTCDFVGVDNQASAVEAVRYLLALGHRRIAHLSIADSTSPVRQRAEGYREALRFAGVEPRPEWTYVVEAAWPPVVGPAVEQFFSLAEPPTALFALEDSLAHYFIVEAEARGLKVPRDVSVIGFDDLERYSPRPALLTTLHQPFDQMGRRATRLILRRLSATEASIPPSTHVLLPTPLVVRSTCRSLERRDEATK